jgi:hypothetical protein
MPGITRAQMDAFLTDLAQLSPSPVIAVPVQRLGAASAKLRSVRS